jgi:hypothetical protein
MEISNVKPGSVITGCRLYNAKVRVTKIEPGQDFEGMCVTGDFIDRGNSGLFPEERMEFFYSEMSNECQVDIII